MRLLRRSGRIQHFRRQRLANGFGDGRLVLGADGPGIELRFFADELGPQVSPPWLAVDQLQVNAHADVDAVFNR